MASTGQRLKWSTAARTSSSASGAISLPRASIRPRTSTVLLRGTKGRG